MLLTSNQYDIFFRVFNEVSLFKSIQKDTNHVRLYKIQVKEEYSKSNISILLRFLLQQNILKEFILEKEAFLIDREFNIDTLNSITPYANISDTATTFNWADAERSYVTNVTNWYKILSSVYNRNKDLFELTDKVERRKV